MTSPDDHPRPFGRRKERHRVTIVHGDRVRAFHVDMGWLTAGAAMVFDDMARLASLLRG